MASFVTSPKTYCLFEAYGIELEYMIVDSQTLNVLPITDKLIYGIAGSYLNDVDCGFITYSNELALHVIELKTTKPQSSLEGLVSHFQHHVMAINQRLEPFGAHLLPTAAHPWMDPFQETKLWNHEANPIYEAYNRIFDCRGHGWSNLQSTHINLAFSGDEEFSKLHTACRLLLPLLPAIAASSPIIDGKLSGKKDTRLDVYRLNQKKVPSITGGVIPEAVHSYEEYQEHILGPIYKEISPHDPESILQEEWLNSRGAIARFERSAIEIRVIDIQECPAADLAIAQAVVDVLKRLVNSHWASFNTLLQFPQKPLEEQFLRCVDHAEEAMVTNMQYLYIFGATCPMTAGQLWKKLLEGCERAKAMDVIVNEGTLSTRITKAYKKNPTKEGLLVIYKQLARCLEKGHSFIG